MTSTPSVRDRELVDRMVALVRNMAASHAENSWQNGSAWRNTAQTLVALLPEPVDPKLKAAREIAAARWDSESMAQWSAAVLSGNCDSHTDVRLALAAIERGIELAETGK